MPFGDEVTCKFNKLGCGKSKTPIHLSSSPGKQEGGMNLNVPSMTPPGGGGLRKPSGANGSLPGLPTGSATGNPNNKVALKPGHSLMDWIRFGRTKDLAGTGGRVTPVTLDDLAKHNTPDDAWTAIKGKVYNISPYMDFHPGGVDELMRSAGIEGTELFEEVHKWVNYDSMLAKCYIGPLAADSPKAIRQKVKMRISNTSLTVGGVGNLNPPIGKPSPRYEWLQNDENITIVIYSKWKGMREENVIIDKTENHILITAMVEDYMYTVALDLEHHVGNEYDVKVTRPSGKVEISLSKIDTTKRWNSIGVPLTLNNKWTPMSNREKSFRECRIGTVNTVTHDTNLYSVELPEGSYMRVPMGHHVYVKADIEGMSISKPYTVVPNTLAVDGLDQGIAAGRIFYLMVKIYQAGALTPIIGNLQPGSTILVSDHEGVFAVNQVDECEHLVMCAAGTGFTPMAGLLLQALLVNPNPNRNVYLFFFNKTTEDILWHDQLNSLINSTSSINHFEVVHVLSQPDDNWSGLSGRIRKEVILERIPSSTEKALFCACGPSAFTQEAIRLAKEEFRYPSDKTHAFLG